VKPEDIEEYLIFADVFDDDYFLMAAALQELGGVRDGSCYICEAIARYKHDKYIDTMRVILDLPIQVINDWKKCYMVRVGRLL
jgi:hypothetical protein